MHERLATGSTCSRYVCHNLVTNASKGDRARRSASVDLRGGRRGDPATKPRQLSYHPAHCRLSTGWKSELSFSWDALIVDCGNNHCKPNLILLFCREFSALFHYSYSPTTWPSSSEYSHTLLMTAVSFTHYILLSRGCNVDCPRNLAKSVTVE